MKVVVDHSKYADSRYYTGSGIYRSVHLVSSDPVHADNWGIFVTTPEINGKEAVVKIETTVLNESDKDAEVTVRHRIMEKDG